MNCKNPRRRQGHGHFQLALAFIEKNLTKAQNPLLSKDKGGTNALGVSKSPSRKTFFLHLNIPCH